MASKYWIKLYIEILNDRKMMQLEDRLFRRVIELFLFAGEIDQDGLLPPIGDVAWRLHMDTEQLETDMIELQRVGILSVDDGNWIVTKYAERQAPVSDAERMRQLRERKQKKQYYDTSPLPERYEPVTNRNVETEKIREETEQTGGVVFSTYEQEIGPLTAHISDQLQELEDKFTGAWLVDAINIASQNNARRIGYIKGILANWHTNGKDAPAPRKIADVEAMASEVYE